MGVDFLNRLFTPYFIFTSTRGRGRSSLLLTTINVLTPHNHGFLAWKLVLGVDLSMVLPLTSLGFEGAAPKIPWVGPSLDKSEGHKILKKTFF